MHRSLKSERQDNCSHAFLSRWLSLAWITVRFAASIATEIYQENPNLVVLLPGLGMHEQCGVSFHLIGVSFGNFKAFDLHRVESKLIQTNTHVHYTDPI